MTAPWNDQTCHPAAASTLFFSLKKCAPEREASTFSKKKCLALRSRHSPRCGWPEPTPRNGAAIPICLPTRPTMTTGLPRQGRRPAQALIAKGRGWWSKDMRAAAPSRSWHLTRDRSPRHSAGAIAQIFFTEPAGNHRAKGAPCSAQPGRTTEWNYGGAWQWAEQRAVIREPGEPVSRRKRFAAHPRRRRLSICATRGSRTCRGTWMRKVPALPMVVRPETWRKGYGAGRWVTMPARIRSTPARNWARSSWLRSWAATVWMNG